MASQPPRLLGLIAVRAQAKVSCSNHRVVNSEPTSHPHDSGPCWFVGATIAGSDQSDRFIDEGLCEHGLPFDTSGNTVSV